MKVQYTGRVVTQTNSSLQTEKKEFSQINKKREREKIVYTQSKSNLLVR
jgi:hypothetical protein